MARFQHSRLPDGGGDGKGGGAPAERHSVNTLPDQSDLSAGGLFKAAFSASAWRGEKSGATATASAAATSTTAPGSASSAPAEDETPLEDWRGGGEDIDPTVLVPREVLASARARHTSDVPNTVFISYCHKDSAFVKRMVAVLKASGIDPWTDYEDLRPSVEWWREIELSIDGADTLINIISPAYLESFNCNREVDYASAKGKVMIPIVITPVDIDKVPKPLAARNFIFWNDYDDFAEKFELLLEAVESGFDDKRFHTVLLSRALHWEGKERDSALLLRGTELDDAEEWVARVSAASHRVSPSELHLAYVSSSRHEVALAREQHAAATRRRMFLFFILLIVAALCLIASFVTLGFAFVEKSRADRATRAAELVTHQWIQEQLVSSLRSVGFAGSVAAHVEPGTLPLALYAYEALSAISLDPEYGTGSIAVGARAAAAAVTAWEEEALTAPFLPKSADQDHLARELVEAIGASSMASTMPPSAFPAGFVLPLGASGGDSAPRYLAHVGISGTLSIIGPLSGEAPEDPYYHRLEAGAVAISEVRGTGPLLACTVTAAGAVRYTQGETIVCIGAADSDTGASTLESAGRLTTVVIDVKSLLSVTSLSSSNFDPVGPFITVTKYAADAGGTVGASGWAGDHLGSSTAAMFEHVRELLEDVPSSAFTTAILVAPSLAIRPVDGVGGSTGEGSGATDAPIASAIAFVDSDRGARAVALWHISTPSANSAPTIHLWLAPPGAEVTAHVVVSASLIVSYALNGISSSERPHEHDTESAVIAVIDLTDGLATALASSSSASARTQMVATSLNPGRIHGLYPVPVASVVETVVTTGSTGGSGSDGTVVWAMGSGARALKIVLARVGGKRSGA
jgi:hypothetical protein